jgi:hypothetical protein
MYQPPDDIGIGPGIYGYNWWISGESPGGWKLVPSLPDGAYFASGSGDNLLFVVPKWDLVIAKTAYSDAIDIPVWDAFFRQVGIALSPAEDGTQFDLAPAAIFTAVDETLDGNGDSAIDLASAADAQIGEVDSADSNYIARALAKFSLPEAPAGKPALAKATLAVYPTAPGGSLPEPLSIWHSTIDNGLELSPSSFEDSSYLDTLANSVQPEDSPYEYYEVDVTDFVLADYAADGVDAMSAFRLQMDEAAFVEDDISHRYLVAMPGMMYRPQLLLTFIPEGIAGDFDSDGDVDGNDFLVWQAGFNVDDRGDANGDGVTNGDDFLIWQNEFGSGIGRGGAAVPEPSCFALTLVIVAVGTAFRRGGISRRPV